MEIFPRGFVLGRNYGNLIRTFKLNTRDEYGNQCQAILKLTHGLLKLANNLKHSENLNFIIKKFYYKKGLEYALFDMNYQMHFRNKDKKFYRDDLKYASFLGSIGEVVGLYVDTKAVNSLLLFLPENLEFSKSQINNLELLKEMISEIDMVETMICNKDYKNNTWLPKEQTLLLLDGILTQNQENKKLEKNK